MPTQTVTITSEHGLHARPAGLVVAAARAHSASITLSNEQGRTAPAVSVLAIIGLGISNGDVVSVQAEGEGAEAAVEAVAEVLRTEV